MRRLREDRYSSVALAEALGVKIGRVTSAMRSLGIVTHQQGLTAEQVREVKELIEAQPDRIRTRAAQADEIRKLLGVG